MGLLVHRQQRGLCLLLIYQGARIFIKIILMCTQIPALVNSLYAIYSVNAQAPLSTGTFGSQTTEVAYLDRWSGICTANRNYNAHPIAANSSLNYNFTRVITINTSTGSSVYKNVNTINPLSRTCKFFIKF